MNDYYPKNIKSKGKILIIDNNAENCKILSFLLQGKGFQVETTSKGEKGLDRLRSGDFDTVLMDARMPDADQWETLQRIQLISQSATSLVSEAMEGGEHPAHGLKVGAHDYDTKERKKWVEKTFQKNRTQKNAILAPPPTRPSVSVVIPTLNEAQNLPLVLPYLPMRWIDEVILVDGRSTDGTVEVAKKTLPSVKVVMEPQPGKGAALRAGYHASQGDIILVMDADGSNDPREIPRFISVLMEGSEFAKGSRFAPGGGTTDMSRIRQMGNQCFVMIVNLCFNVHFTDLCYGMHAFWRYCLNSIQIEDVDGFEIDTAIYLRTLRQKFKLVEVPSFEGYRFYGHGKLKALPDGWRVLKTIVREVTRQNLPVSQELYMGFRAGRVNPDHSRYEGN